MSERASRAELVERVRVLRKAKEPSARAKEETLAEQLHESGVNGVLLCDGWGVLVEDKRKAVRVDTDLVLQVLRKTLDGASGVDDVHLMAAHEKFFEKRSKEEAKLSRKMERMRRRREREERQLSRKRVKEEIASLLASQSEIPDDEGRA
jgi:hypothetical protein